MTGICFQSWERFLNYAQKKEGIVTKANYNSINAECLKANVWEHLQKTLPTSDYDELTKNKNKIGIRSFCIPEKTGQLIFYAVGKEDKTGVYLCVGYGIVDETATKDRKIRFIRMKDELSRRSAFYCIGTERDYWENYAVLQMDLPEPLLEYLLSQVTILDNVYGAERNMESDSGGFCAVMPKVNEVAKEAYQKMLKKYHIQESKYECRDIITADGIDWIKTLYLTNNDYGILIIYLKEAKAFKKSE
ncbi:MAG: hypothetical protein HFI75_08030 [Lachnospiraceae bacterium]|nr:hypothetical protein [Lachnospiraceae bacterium]